jgi:hypothetical protein
MKPSLHLNLFESITQGMIETPAGDDRPATDRWLWFADLYGNRAWGLVSVVEGFPRMAANQIAAECVDTSAPTATIEHWQAIAVVARTARSAARSQSLERARNAVTDTCTDTIDHLTEYTFGGLEAILGAVDAIGHEHEFHVAMSFVDNACTAWERCMASPAIRDRSVA